MDYMFMLYTSDTEMPELKSGELGQRMGRHIAIIDDANARGVFKGASPLQPVSTAMTVRPAQGKFSITDGPFAETKEALGGYYIITCKDVNEAKYWAGRLAETGCATAVEFRALADMTEVMQHAVSGVAQTANAVNA